MSTTNITRMGNFCLPQDWRPLCSSSEILTYKHVVQVEPTFIDR